MTTHVHAQVAIMSRQLTIFQCSSVLCLITVTAFIDDSVSDDIFDMDDDNCDDVCVTSPNVLLSLL